MSCDSLRKKTISASVGALSTSLLMTPFDVVKTRMQASRSVNSTLDHTKDIIRREGVASLWRGLTPTLLASIPATILYYIGYEQTREYFDGAYAPLFAGSLSRIMAVTFISPVELIRTRVQVYHSKRSPEQLLILGWIYRSALHIGRCCINGQLTRCRCLISWTWAHHFEGRTIFWHLLVCH